MYDHQKRFRGFARIGYFALLLFIMGVGIAVPNNSERCVLAADEYEAAQYLQSLGYTVTLPAEEVKTIRFQAPLSAEEEDYLKLQEKQGFSRNAFLNTELKRYTFTVIDHPGFENSNSIKLHLFLNGHTVAGGDLCSVEPNGFMDAFR